MEKITKSSDKVLIDPNEPLILPDGTALVGRVEWFLYALCCLDYQNLPTPMSRIEEFANALITGEVPNIEPQSRAEQFFLAILDGNVSNLPQPQSRSEILLDKLARGEFDLSDVEPIQSRYELLLAYLIKNGGIGNIDYVLYEFSEAMKTMYNTVEKPFKSLELSGNTLVNCVLEDTENDDYTSFDKDYSETSFTINGTSEGAIKSAILSGQTLVNMIDYDNPLNPHITKDSDTLTITSQSSIAWFNSAYPLIGMTYEKKYRVMWDSLTYTHHDKHGAEQIIGVYSVDSTNNTQVVIRYNRNDNSNYFDFTIPSNAKIENVSIRIHSATYTGEQGATTIVKGLKVLEYQDGMENWDIPYFEGIQSVKMPVLTTRQSANLFNKNNVSSISDLDYLGDDFIECNYGEKFSISLPQDGVHWTSLWFYDENKKLIYSNVGDSISSQKTIYVPSVDCKFLKLKTMKSCVDVVMLTRGEPLPYEPYSDKTNILTTTSKNLFDMNRPYDTITDSQATVVQDTNQITVSSSAESGMYVNANFILDKDFFAGKTVTGSCLYESDEKDIGTVQIYYQDGNGEHHYQWIRTPRTFTFPNNFIGDVILSVSANNTGTPQSNTVTVKNIQLELGSTATSYEPYSEGVTLRGIGDVKDELNLLTGEVVERIGEIVLDGSENWVSQADSNWNNDTHISFRFIINNMSINFWNSGQTNCISDKFKTKSLNDDSYIVAEEFIGSDGTTVDGMNFNIKLLRSRLKGNETVDGFKQWLSQNPIAVQYELATESIKTVGLNVVDQNNIKIDKIHVFDGTTHVNASSDELTPTVNIGKSVSYPTIIKPNTKYTVDLKRNDKPLTVNLGGTEVTFTSGETRKTITTPSTLTNDKLSYYGVGAKCNEIMLIEGEVEGNVDYFTGMQSVVMQNQMPILTTIGKNLFDTNAVPRMGSEYNDFTKAYATTIKPILNLKPNTTYQINGEITQMPNRNSVFKFVDNNGVEIQGTYVSMNNTNGSEPKKIKINNKFTTGNNGEIYFNTFPAYTQEDLDKLKDIFNSSKIQIEEGVQATSYEPYKTSILSLSEEVKLCGINNTKDMIDCNTKTLIKNINEVIFNGSDDENWTMQPNLERDNTLLFQTGYDIPNGKNHHCISDKYNHSSSLWSAGYDEEGIMIGGGDSNYNRLDLRIAKNKLSSYDVSGLKLYLQSNPITIQYKLANPIVETVNLSVIDQNGNTIPKIKSYKDVTHLEVTVPKQSLLPNVSAEVATDNSKDMSSLTTKHQEISEAQATIQDNIQSQSDEIDTALMATTEIFESILE